MMSNGTNFSTRDQDNDINAVTHCAQKHKGLKIVIFLSYNQINHLRFGKTIKQYYLTEILRIVMYVSDYSLKLIQI